LSIIFQNQFISACVLKLMTSQRVLAPLMPSLPTKVGWHTERKVMGYQGMLAALLDLSRESSKTLMLQFYY
jgi:hypothetical protein